MELLKNIFYINLEERTDRRKHVEEQLNLLGVSGERISACKMAKGCVGCTMSHIRCLELAKMRGYESVCIMEDDICFKEPGLFLSNLHKFHQNQSIDWDVIIVGGNVVKPYEIVNDYCIRIHNTQTTTCYIVKSHYYSTLIENFKESVKNLMRNELNRITLNNYAIDMYWKQLQRVDKWYMITPLTVSQLPGYSDIEKRVVNYDFLMLDLKKEWYYKQFE